MSDKKRHHEKAEDFQRLVESIRSVEDEADRVKTEYKSKIAELLKKGREKIVERREFYNKKAADAKNKVLSSERKKIQALAEAIIADAKKEASLLKSKKLNRKELEAVFKNFISLL